MKYIDISDAVNSIIQSPPDMPGNSVDTTLRPVASYQGTDGIKLIIIGQDPTVRRVESRRNITILEEPCIVISAAFAMALILLLRIYMPRISSNTFIPCRLPTLPRC